MLSERSKRATPDSIDSVLSQGPGSARPSRVASCEDVSGAAAAAAASGSFGGVPEGKEVLQWDLGGEAAREREEEGAFTVFRAR